MSHYLQTVPRADGYRMPGEFEPRAGCWMLFPERTDTWRDGALPALQILQTVFTDRKIIGISGGREISLGDGNIHCITQQQPEGCRHFNIRLPCFRVH